MATANTTPQKASDYGITFSQGAQATPEGVANAQTAGLTPTTPTNQTTPVNTAQPNPATVNATPATGASPTAPAPNPTTPPPTPVGNGTINPATGMLENPQQDAMNAALKQAQAGGPAPQTPGEAKPIVDNALKTNPPPVDTTNIDTALANDPGYQKLLEDHNAYKAESSTSLVDTFKQMETDAGLPAINTQLLNLKNIIDGSEDDIRKEVQAAGGFATNSQILGLASARNKQNIKDYNTLLDTKKMAEDRINTMIGLSKDDKQMALNKLNDQLNFDTKMIDYRDKFVQHATDSYNKIIDKLGYSGLYDEVKTDPSAVAAVEKTLGLHPGGLQALASTSGTPNLKDMPTSYQEYVLAKKEGFKGTYNDYQTMDANRKRSVTNNTTTTYNQAQDQAEQGDIKATGGNLKSVMGKDGFVSPQDWKRAYSDWLGAGHKGADFVSNFSQYVNPADPQDYGIKL